MLLIGQTLKYEIGPWAHLKLEDPTSIGTNGILKLLLAEDPLKDQYISLQGKNMSCFIQKMVLLSLYFSQRRNFHIVQIQGIPK